MSGLPSAAAEWIADWPPELLDDLNHPDRRDLRRQALGRSPSVFRQALLDAGWTRGNVKAWLRTGAIPEPRP